ncbi:hypothetical protein [Streptomyces sp. H27-C3]|uniref:hypothetical protein n=1 Tax=Streptomyces sp. H27-C3 TaxID=3046305 RepID=UPI0024BA7589|nr:hypothetical protein [Streptomyces sp. H27-C3]MDJ0460751.1 hypothetical protein [Streptomyces sp. H27-C3]
MPGTRRYSAMVEVESSDARRRIDRDASPSASASVTAVPTMRGTGTTRPPTGTDATPDASAEVTADPAAAAGSSVAV